jgi:hypothetical protein
MSAPNKLGNALIWYNTVGIGNRGIAVARDLSLPQNVVNVSGVQYVTGAFPVV